MAALGLLPGPEIDEVRAVLTGPAPAAPPRVLQVIHTPRDTLAEVTGLLRAQIGEELK